jgi:asparagine synthase (glutamine-hydrolysing)
MLDHPIAAIHDPRRALAAGEARRRLAATFGPAVRESGALTVAGSGGAIDRCVVDGAVSLPSAWAASWPPALATLRELRGAFALIVWDAETGHALAARDHLGARPLFYASAGPALYVASEIAPLLRLLPRRPEPDRDEVARHLALGTGTPGHTLFTGLREVPAAHALLLDEQGWRLERYWRPKPRPGLEQADETAAAAALRDGVQAAVDRHTRALSGSKGVLASGGLDSSAVLACAVSTTRAAGDATPAAWLGVPEPPELDESPFLEDVAAYCGTESVRVRVPSGPIAPRASAFLDRWAVPLEHPGAAFFLPVRESASARGVTALLDGEGGDELFGCEPLLIGDRLRSGDFRGAARLVRELPGVTRLDTRSLAVVARRWVAPALLPPATLNAVRRMRAGRRSAPEWLRGAAHDAARQPESDSWHRDSEPRWRAHLGWVLTDGRDAFGVHNHLRRMATMAGVEDVHPFLDVDLIELVLGLPPHLAFHASFDRKLLREAMRGLLPESVRLRRGKVFFGALLRDALTGPDHLSVDRTLTGTSLELVDLVDLDALKALWTGGPERCARGPLAWATESWRAFALELWLRREAGRTDV